MSELKKQVRVRFAPSPTGHLHLGGARTALYDYLFAKKHGGQFILRIEDTDRKRLVEGAEQEIMDGLRWMGIDWDEGPDKNGPFGPYRQSERKGIYEEYSKILIETGHAYYCFCKPERLESVRQEQQKNKLPVHYDGLCRDIPVETAKARVEGGEKNVIRFKTPLTGSTSVHDLIRGEIKVENQNLDDYIIVKSDGFALYHLASVIDDHLMEVSHVIRGSEWLPTFPLHSLIYRAFNWEEPTWVHLSVFLKPSGKGKMSKREAAEAMKDGYSIFLKDMEGLGYTQEAVCNWIALMGWSYDDHTEFFLLQDLVDKFDLRKLNPSPAAINFTKLDYFNGLHIRNLSNEELATRLFPIFFDKGLNPENEILVKIAPIIKERLVTLDDALDFATFFFQENVNPNPAELIVKGLSAVETRNLAIQIRDILIAVPEMKTTAVEPVMRSFVEKAGLNPGQVFGLIRIAVTGQKISPPLFECMEIIGKEIVIQRLENTIQILSKLG